MGKEAGALSGRQGHGHAANGSLGHKENVFFDGAGTAEVGAKSLPKQTLRQ